LYFSISLCIAEDIAGDIGIIGYHSIEKKREISHGQTDVGEWIKNIIMKDLTLENIAMEKLHIKLF